MTRHLTLLIRSRPTSVRSFNSSLSRTCPDCGRLQRGFRCGRRSSGTRAREITRFTPTRKASRGRSTRASAFIRGPICCTRRTWTTGRKSRTCCSGSRLSVRRRKRGFVSEGRSRGGTIRARSTGSGMLTFLLRTGSGSTKYGGARSRFRACIGKNTKRGVCSWKARRKRWTYTRLIMSNDTGRSLNSGNWGADQAFPALDHRRSL